MKKTLLLVIPLLFSAFVHAEINCWTINPESGESDGGILVTFLTGTSSIDQPYFDSNEVLVTTKDVQKMTLVQPSQTWLRSRSDYHDILGVYAMATGDDGAYIDIKYENQVELTGAGDATMTYRNSQGEVADYTIQCNYSK
jgi:hypothetical protein